MAKSHFTRIVAVLFLGALATGCSSVARQESYSSQTEFAETQAVKVEPARETHAASPAPARDPGLSGTYKFYFFGEVGIADYERPSGSLWQQAFAGYWTDWDTRPAMFRVGVEYNGFRFSYFDLGKYKIAAEAGDDEGAIEACACVVGGDTDMYFTQGNMRGFAVTYKQNLHSILPLPILKHVFVEGGPALFRFSLSIRKDDGWSFDETLWGYGHVIGAGIEYKNLTIGWYGYRTKIGGKFEEGRTPAGTGGANIFVIGISF